MTPFISPDTVHRPTTRKVSPTDKELLLLARAGDKRAKEIIVNRYLPLVHGMARRYRGSGLDYEELVQEGSIGILVAIDRFDLDKGFAFSTYASYWVRAKMAASVQKSARTVYLPRRLQEDKARLYRESEAFSAVHGRRPSAKEISETLGWCISRTSRILSAPVATTIDDVTYFPFEEGVETWIFSCEESPETSDESLYLLRMAMGSLNEADRTLIERLYGIGCAPSSLRQMASERGISRSGVHKRKRRIEGQLRTAVRRLSSGQEVL